MKILTDIELAERWHCSVRDVQDMSRAGQLRGFRARGKWRYREDVIEAYELGTAPAVVTPTVVQFASRRRRAS